MTSKEQYVLQLRELADFYERASEELPRPPINLNVFCIVTKDIPVILEDCGKLEKAISGGFVELRKELTKDSTLVFNITQDKVCERRVVGQRWIPEYSNPAHFEDQVEWDCKPILASIKEKDAN